MPSVTFSMVRSLGELAKYVRVCGFGYQSRENPR